MGIHKILFTALLILLAGCTCTPRVLDFPGTSCLRGACPFESYTPKPAKKEVSEYVLYLTGTQDA